MKTNAALKRAARRRSGWYLYLSAQRRSARALQNMRRICHEMETTAAAALARLGKEL